MELKIRFKGLKDDVAILKIDDDEREIFWPQDKLPSNISEGDFLNFLISPFQLDKAKRDQSAKDILNEILNIE